MPIHWVSHVAARISSRIHFVVCGPNEVWPDGAGDGATGSFGAGVDGGRAGGADQPAALTLAASAASKRFCSSMAAAILLARFCIGVK